MNDGRQIAVIGGGTWGTALAIMAARKGHLVRLWSRNLDVVESVNRERVNKIYLPHAVVPDSVNASDDFKFVLVGAEIVILAAPSHATREILNAMRASVFANMIFVSATKGIEIENGKRMSEVFRDVLGEEFKKRFVSLSGPSFAKEVIAGHPTAIVAASADVDAGNLIQSQLSFENLRIYTNEDVVGTELGGAVKNVMAIAAGMVAGLGFGANSVAALITRGLAEISRLVLHQGGKIETMLGLAGLGDLVLTCTGALSRNREVGVQLGKGYSLAEIQSGMNEVAEGIKTTLAVRRLAERLGIEMPITNEVHAVLYQGKQAKDAAIDLMNRPLKAEV